MRATIRVPLGLSLPLLHVVPLAQHISIPSATGERLHTIFEVEMLLARGAVQYVRPDVCMAGGLSHCKKIAALAEAYHVGGCRTTR